MVHIDDDDAFLCRCIVQDEDEVPDDETINQMLARTEVEYEKFQVGFHVCELRWSFVFKRELMQLGIYELLWTS